MDPIQHLNEIFSHPSTLSSVSQTYRTLQAYQDDLDDEIEALEDERIQANAECLQRMETSKAELADLFRRIENVRERALQTERNITEMTADIKQLDNHEEEPDAVYDGLEETTDADNRLRATTCPQQDETVQGMRVAPAGCNTTDGAFQVVSLDRPDRGAEQERRRSAEGVAGASVRGF